MGIVLSSCDHVAKVVSWSVDVSLPAAPLIVGVWGCTNCDELFTAPPESSSDWAEKDHSNCDDTCFSCKARSLKVAYCGIGGGDATSQKKWDANLDAYRSAKAQGIQPKSTRASAIEAAIRQSDKTGTAFKAS